MYLFNEGLLKGLMAVTHTFKSSYKKDAIIAA
jgi:hypothetical protein